MTEITGDAVKGCALTSTDDHMRRMIGLMKRGARVSLTDIPGDPTFLSSSITGGDARKIAERILAALDPSPRVADLEAENARLRVVLEMISTETKESNEPIGRSVYKALATCGEIADLALSTKEPTHD